VRKVASLDPRDPCPEPDVARGRVLGLEPRDAFDRSSDREIGTFEEKLTGEERAVELPLGEGPLQRRLRAQALGLPPASFRPPGVDSTMRSGV
jgi:hypothetical protein